MTTTQSKANAILAAIQGEALTVDEIARKTGITSVWQVYAIIKTLYDLNQITHMHNRYKAHEASNDN